MNPVEQINGSECEMSLHVGDEDGNMIDKNNDIRNDDECGGDVDDDDDDTRRHNGNDDCEDDNDCEDDYDDADVDGDEMSLVGSRTNVNIDNGKRYRTNYSRIQITRLEQEFRREKYLSRLKRTELAKELGLKESTIKVWFQNRRMKEKRQLTTINIPQILANSDPFLYSYLLDSAKAYYNFTSQFNTGHPLANHSAQKIELATTEAAIAAFMTSHKLMGNTANNNNNNNNNNTNNSQIQFSHAFTPVCPTTTPRELQRPMGNKFTNSTSSSKKEKPIANSEKITFRPYIDS